MLMEEMQYYLCSREECIEKVRAGLLHKQNELYERLGRSMATSIQTTVRNTFFSANYYVKDGKIVIYLFDEVNPEAITDYLMREKEYPVERQEIYELVCRIQQRLINQFYGELDLYKKDKHLKSRIPKNGQLPDGFDYGKLITQYAKAIERRAQVPYKRIRKG